jgi:hypothetical protein
MRLICFTCGKPVSTEVPDSTIVRGTIDCPECVEDERPDQGDGEWIKGLVDDGVAAEARRIRRELLEWLSAEHSAGRALTPGRLCDALDRICPKHPTPTAPEAAPTPVSAQEIHCRALEIIEYQDAAGARFDLVNRSDREVVGTVSATWAEIRGAGAEWRDLLLRQLMTGHSTLPAPEAEERPDTSSPAPRD